MGNNGEIGVFCAEEKGVWFLLILLNRPGDWGGLVTFGVQGKQEREDFISLTTLSNTTWIFP